MASNDAVVGLPEAVANVEKEVRFVIERDGVDNLRSKVGDFSVLIRESFAEYEKDQSLPVQEAG